MLFNDLLTKAGLDLREVLLLRHSPQQKAFARVLPRIALEQPDVFNAYQATQRSKRVEQDMSKAKHVASFLKLPSRRGQAKRRAIFIGLFRHRGTRTITRQSFAADHNISCLRVLA